MIIHSQQRYGRAALNKINDINDLSIDGARALLESFYYAFNQRNLQVFEKVWAEHPLIQLNNPLGGILRGHQPITHLYRQIFTGVAKVWVELDDIVEFQAETMVVFAGRESGEFCRNGKTISLSIRTSRIIQWFGNETGWRQVHHHGSIDKPELLREYQCAVLNNPNT